MGILNVTPDSFSDGGRFFAQDKLRVDAALVEAAQMLQSGAAIIDVGGESTRPGAAEVSVQEEMDRVLPVIERLNQELDVIISLDSSQPRVMEAALALGIGLINDVRSLALGDALEVASRSGLPVCVMHMKGSPATMQQAPEYQQVQDEVLAFMQEQIVRYQQAGIQKENILLDPGFGFGKSLAHNLTLLNRLDELVALGYPVLSGTSRKSMIGAVTGRDASKRLAGSLATAILAAQKGVHLLRVHDVAETVDALKLLKAVQQEEWEIEVDA